MASVKEVKVVINGEEFVSAAAKKAGEGMEEFKNKQPRWIQSLTDLRAAWQFFSGAVERIKDVVRTAIAAYDDVVLSQRRLEGTSRLTGIALEELRITADIGRHAFGLSTVTANSFAVEIAKLGQAAGDTTRSREALQAFLDIGAARGLTATQTLQALQQSLLGIDEGTDRLFGKNPSGLWKDYEGVLGKVATKFDDGDKAAALLHAALTSGARVVGEHSRSLDTTVGKLGQYQQANEEAASQAGESMTTLRETFLAFGGNVIPWFWDRLRRAMDDLTSTIHQAEGAGYQYLAVISKVLGQGDKFAEYSAKAEAAFSKADEYYARAKTSSEDLAKANDRMRGSLADVIPEAANTRDAFREMVNPFDQTRRAADEVAESVGKIGPRANMTKKEVEDYTRSHIKSSEDLKKEARELDQQWNDYISRLREWYRVLREEQVKVTDVIKTMAPAVRDSMKTEHIRTFNDAQKELKDAADAAVAAMKKHGDLPPLVKNVEREARGLSEALKSGAQTALDVGDALGIIDDQAKLALTSSLNVADAISRMMTGGVTFAGVGAVVGGVASIVSNMMQGDRERRELTKKNTEALDKLRRDGVRMSTAASGEQITGVSGFLSPELVNQLATMTSSVGRAAGNQVLVQALAKAGLRLSDLDAVASEFGLNLRRSDGQIDLAQLPALLDALRMSGGSLTRVGNSFTDQLDFFRESQDLQGATGPGALNGLLDFLRNVGGITALDGLSADDPMLREKLLDLFTQLNNNTLGAGQLGKATGAQFRDILGDIIRSLNSSSGGTAPSTGDSGSGEIGSGGDTGGGSIPSGTIAGIVDRIQAQTEMLGTYHTASLGFLERTAKATEATADHTGSTAETLHAIHAMLGRMADGRFMDYVDEDLGRRQALAFLAAGRMPGLR